MKHLVNINGKLLPADEPQLRVENWAFRYGYSVFETMMFRGGAIRLAAYHWDRLLTGMTLLRMNVRQGFLEELEGEIFRTATENNCASGPCRVRLQVFSGHGGLVLPEDTSSGYCIEAAPLDHESLNINAKGLELGLADAVKHTGSLARLKTGSAIPYAVAARQAAQAGWDDALLLNEHGRIADSTISNVFWIKKGIIHTTPLSEGGVGGVMRRHLLTVLPLSGFQVCETAAYPEDLYAADELFLSNAIRGIRWAGSFGNHRFHDSLMREIGEILSHSL